MAPRERRQEQGKSERVRGTRERAGEAEEERKRDWRECGRRGGGEAESRGWRTRWWRRRRRGGQEKPPLSEDRSNARQDPSRTD